MKLLLTFFAIAILFSCSKENPLEPPSGTWTIVETNDARTGMGTRIQTYTPSSEISLQFDNNGNLILSGSNPGTAKSPLWEYDKYQMLEGNFIRFYQSAGTKQMEVYYEVEGNLFLNYPDRHGYEEQFLRIR